MTNRCRVCHRPLCGEPLLVYKNMPRAAQFLPDSGSLKKDSGIVLRICQCSGCGIVQLSNSPVPYYREVVRASAYSKEMRAFRLNQFGEFARKHLPRNGRVIEIGCGRGEYLSLMKQCGMDCYGLEYSKESVRHCAENGLKVARGYIDDPVFRIRRGKAGTGIVPPFDAFCILNFLEHFPDPGAALTGLHNILTDEAVGIVEVPNLDMILEKSLFSEFARDHLLYFTRDTLTRTLALNGFEVTECGEILQRYVISAIVKARKRLDVASFNERLEFMKREISRYTDRLQGRKLAVWGAGHQALAMLALADIAGKVRYVVDSAPFKQHRFTPATHVPIVAPEMLESEPVDAIIVMAAGYSDEVAGIIRRRFGRKMNVHILRDSGLEEVK